MLLEEEREAKMYTAWSRLHMGMWSGRLAVELEVLPLGGVTSCVA